jgi:hypothetical protein
VGRVAERLSDRLAQGGAKFAVAALAAVVPPALIAGALKSAEELEERQRKEAGKKPRKRRKRKLPGNVVAWLLIGMALFRSRPIKAVLRQVVDGIPGFSCFGIAEMPVSTSLAEARDRIGMAMQFLFERLVVILARKHEAATTWLGLVVYAIDGTCFLVPDEPANDSYFGRAGSSRGGKSAFPQMRAVLVITAFTHLVVQAALGPYSTGEMTLAETLLPAMAPGSLVLMDRAYYAYAWLAAIAGRKSFFLVRVKGGERSLKPKKTRKLGKDEWLATLTSPQYLKLDTTLEVRLVKCRVKGFPRLLLATNLLDPFKYPAAEVARLYYERWEAELAYREIKVYQAAEKALTFRSHTPERIKQEFYGLLVAYNAVRSLMAEAAQEVGLDPRRLSFTGCLDRINATIPQFAFALPEKHGEILSRLRIDLAQQRLPKKRTGRRYVRAVKRPVGKWPRKRPGATTKPKPRPARKRSARATQKRRTRSARKPAKR